MSYAIETKKRKFDRILEGLSDRPGSPSASLSRFSLNSRNNASTTSLSQDSASDSSKRRRVSPQAAPTAPTFSKPVSLSGNYLPSSRAAFIERLSTFRQVTIWHIPSTDPINAAAWVKRGWICEDTDTVSCGACKERLHVDLSVDTELLETHKTDEQGDGDVEDTGDRDDAEDFGISSEVYDNIVKRYQDLIVTAHAQGCLWRSRGCDASIQRIEGLLNTNITLSGMRSRYESLMTRPDEIPNVETLPTTTLTQPEDLDEFQSNTDDGLDANALRLAICGWERKAEDVIECRYCFRSLGLWLYRGESPAIEKLDAVENHLEYCPWRSAEAQDTEVQPTLNKTGDDLVAKKQRVPGWVLVYQAISKNNRHRRPRPPSSIATSEPTSSMGSKDSTTSEQREKKMKDLLRRIKEIKKPFNVKGLLKRKDHHKT